MGFEIPTYPNEEDENGSPLKETQKNKLTIECAAEHPNYASTRVLFDGKLVGGIQRIMFRQAVGDAWPTIEIDQIVYTKGGLELAARLRQVPFLKYTPTFMNPGGAVVAEEDFAP